MPGIHVLPIHLVNKIAAGEVIERPASIVKELVENALDAGAGRVDVSIEDGGRKLVAVSDDGCGMGADDAALAFAPHATSKIAVEDDLFRIVTMGFRGEALASIASVSHAHIRTRRKDDPGGFEIAASGETVGVAKPCAAAPGTAVTVRDLFFNMPARRKFLKTANTELGHVTEQLARLALPRPHVAFSLTHNGRNVQTLPSVESTLRRAADLFGPDLAAGLLPIAARRGKGLAVSGLVGTPASARASGKWQYFFLNGRYIRDRLLSHALREAYRGLADPSRWPAAMVFIEIDPAEVDVNVHPTKTEVRFRDGQFVHGELLAALKETLNKSNLAVAAELGDSSAGDDATADPGKDSRDKDAPDDDRRASMRQAIADFFKSAPAPQPRFTFAAHSDVRRSPEPVERTAAFGEPFTAESASRLLASDSPIRHAVDTSVPQALAAEPAQTFNAVQVHNAYIVVQCDDGLEIIDQHALHERLTYNDLRKRLSLGALAAQRLLLPTAIDASESEIQAAGANAKLLERLGIELVPFGPRKLAIQQFPTLLAQRGVEPEAFVREALDKLAEDTSADAERLLEELLQTMACKAAVKAGDRLGPEEIDALLVRRVESDKASACPHGRPTTLKMTLKELEKQFKR